VEAMLERGLHYISFPEWLKDALLRDRCPVVITGTHGKTTTASMLAWILEDAGLAPGFLIGGIPTNFGTSARFGKSPFFVVEADEYDTAFFDKRAKFVHYRPRTLILNNLEFDHADIYKDMDAIHWQFHQLLRMVPSDGQIISNGSDANLVELMEMGCWTPVQTFGTDDNADWLGRFGDTVERHIGMRSPSGAAAEAHWKMGGVHNLENALAAVAAAVSVGVQFEQAVDALSRFEGIKRRMERTATVANIAIYDDFAHHPTAIQLSIASMRRRYPGHRVVVAMEPRSNTMKMGVHNEELANSLQGADLIWMYRPDDMGDGFDASLDALGSKLTLHKDYDELVNDMSKKVLGGDQVIFMSNGGFGAARQTLTALLQRTRGT
jgi:UDP-N-acetylmuramate: L-alanyl-gamma-D-glutamyl-meso-diaminopimelate ligase